MSVWIHREPHGGSQSQFDSIISASRHDLKRHYVTLYEITALSPDHFLSADAFWERVAFISKQSEKDSDCFQP